eukprot:EG_transcript_38437
MAFVAQRDLSNPQRFDSVAHGVTPWLLLDVLPLQPSAPPQESQGAAVYRQSVGEALQELQRQFAAFSQQVAADVQALQSENVVVRGQLQEEKDARSVQEKEFQKLQSALGEEKAKAERVAADVQALQSENVVVRGQLQEEKDARSVQEKEFQKLQSALG